MPDTVSDNDLINPDAVLQLPPEAIRHRLGHLIRRYVARHSPYLSRAIFSHFDALCRHPQLCADASERCDYRRARLHWHCLAELDAARPPLGASMG